MITRFVKLSTDITKSTIWAEDHPTFRLWIYLMASADRQGVVRGTIPGIAIAARITLEECELAIRKFLSPDKYSANPANEGRRIQEVEGGWLLLNYETHRNRRGGDPEWQAQRHAKNQKAYRDRKNGQGDRVADNEAVTVTTEAEADTNLKSSGSANSNNNTQSSGSIDSGAEPKQVRSAPDPAGGVKPERKLVGTIPLNTGEEFPIYQADVDQWQKTYPAVNVKQELKEFKQWCIDNPTRKKTKSGVRRSINTWLGREQDKGGNHGIKRGGYAKQSVADDNIREAQELISELRARRNGDLPSGGPGELLRAPVPQGRADDVPRNCVSADRRPVDNGTGAGPARGIEVLPLTREVVGVGGRRNAGPVF